MTNEPEILAHTIGGYVMLFTATVQHELCKRYETRFNNTCLFYILKTTVKFQVHCINKGENKG